MKIKLSWIFFIPAFIAVAALKIAQPVFLGQGQNVLGLSGVSAAYTSAGIAALLLVLCAVLSAADKKTSGIYVTGRNYASGILSYLAAAAVSADCAITATGCLSSGQLQVMDFVDMLLLVVAAVAFLVIGTGFFTGKNYTMGMSVLILMPAIWSCVRVFKTFWGYTTYSVTSTDMTDLIAYVLLTLYFFYMASVLSVMSGKNPVKSCFVFGLPAIVMLFGYCISKIMYVAAGISEAASLLDAEFLEFLVFGLLILSNVVTLTRKAKTIEENKGLLQQLEEENAEFDDTDNDKEDTDNGSSEQSESYLDDEFLLYTQEDNTVASKNSIKSKKNQAAPEKEEPVKNKIAEEQTVEAASSSDSEADEAVSKRAADTAQSVNPLEQRMSEIDRLILEIESDGSN